MPLTLKRFDERPATNAKLIGYCAVGIPSGKKLRRPDHLAFGCFRAFVP
jgi:hypothetical protein